MNTIDIKISKSCGDIIYSLPSIKALCRVLEVKAHYYIGQSRYTNLDVFNAVRKLLEEQSYIEGVYRLASKGYDIDFDNVKVNIINQLPAQFHKAVEQQSGVILHLDISNPWLTVEPSKSSNFDLYNVTGRYNNYEFDFNKHILLNKNKAYFVGTAKEYANYSSHDIEHLYTADLYEVARLIKSANNVYCNQSSILTIAQGLNHPNIYLAKDKRFTSVVLNKEKIL